MDTHTLPKSSPRHLPHRAIWFGTILALVLLTLVGKPAGATAPPSPYLDSDGMPLPFASDDEILEFLQNAEVVAAKELSGGSTRPLRLDLQHNGVRARAVFRSVDRRRERLRLRDGRSYAVFYDRAVAEVAAYRLSRLLGLGMVPPTVTREYNGRQGSVQLWIERARTDQQRRDSGDTAPHPVRWMRQRAVMEVFDALVGNADRNTGNSLVDEQWRLWLIDHTRAFQRPRDRDDMSRVNHVPEELLARLEALDPERIRATLAPYLEPGQIAALLDRRTALLEYVDTLVAERGQGAVVLRRSS